MLFLLFCVAVLFFFDFLFLFLFDKLHLFLFLTLEDVQGVKYPLVVGLQWGQVWSLNHYFFHSRLWSFFCKYKVIKSNRWRTLVRFRLRLFRTENRIEFLMMLQERPLKRVKSTLSLSQKSLIGRDHITGRSGRKMCPLRKEKEKKLMAIPNLMSSCLAPKG